MDTKLKRYKLKRVIAFLLAFCLFFTSGVLTCYAVKGIYYYDRFEKDGSYTSTTVFKGNFRNLEYNLINSGEARTIDTYEDYLKTSDARRGFELQNQVKEALEFLGKYDISIAKEYEGLCYIVNIDGKIYEVRVGEVESICLVYGEDDEEFVEDTEDEYYTKDETAYYVTVDEVSTTKPAKEESTTAVTKPETTAKAEKKAEVTTQVTDKTNSKETTTEAQTEATTEKSDVLQTTMVEYEHKKYGNNIDSIVSAISFVNENSLHYSYIQDSNEDILKGAAENMKQFYEDYKYDSQFWIGNIEETCSSVKFAIFYSSTGKVYTNCGVTEKDDTETILKKLGGYDYAEYFEDGKFNTEGLPVKTMIINGLYHKLNKSACDNTNFGENTDLMVGENVSKAYFAYMGNGDNDIFGLSQAAYNSYLDGSNAKNGKDDITALILGALITFLLGCAVCVYIFVIAGKTDDGEVKIRFTDKVPFIINFTFAAGFITLCVMGVIGINAAEFLPYEVFWNFSGTLDIFYPIANLTNSTTALLYACGLLTATGLIESAVRNIKNRTFLKHTLTGLVVGVIVKIFRKIRKVFHKIAEKAKAVYAQDYAYGNGKKFLLLGTLVICASIGLGFLILGIAAAKHSFFWCFVAFLIFCAIIAYLVLCLVSFDRMASGVAEIKLGSLTCTIDTRLMPGFMRSMAEDIASIRSGLSNAVNQAVKDQATKTELLTNVTHDLKTPLTSIITYVDFLKQTDDPEKQQEYLQVLDEKSQRLKKLIDDLVQASKAASGNIEVNIMPLNLCEFATQIIGENEDEFRANGIEFVLKIPDESVNVLADGNVTSRIFENLLSNIRKYALKGTRVYVEVTSGEGYSAISFKNVSALPLESDGEKLTERFYRGDSSRTGEGSGLGLSIARDLCTAQGGKLNIETDGDLFKATIVMPKVKD